MVPVGINGIVKDVLIDSSSMSNLINNNGFETLKTQGLSASLTKCDKKLFGYGGRQLSVCGQFEAELSNSDKKVQSLFLVTVKGRCLLGQGSSKRLGILRIGAEASNEIVCSSSVGTDIK